jgi:hypothetical protein
MKHFTITIPDNKENIFIEMMKSISFVKKIEADTFSVIPQEHKEIVLNRIQQLENHPERCLTWEDIDSKIRL